MTVQVSLPDDLAEQIDRVATDRSAFVSDAVQRLLRESAEQSTQDKVARKTVADILTLGSQRRDAYLRLDELEMQLQAGGALVTAVRTFLPSKGSRANREELDQTVRTIYDLRGRMDALRASLPPSCKTGEVDHLWNFENTTSLSQQRERSRRLQLAKGNAKN
jgi:Arc/MetJ-type ribon-helix-helix transcriptional regulator